MNILSLFDGISCARVALERADIPIKKYYSSEIDKHAIKVSQKNYPDIECLGNVKDVKPFEIDLLIGGSPCTDLSIAKKNREGLEGERSCLFWEYVRLLRECKPKYFLLENVASMSIKDKNIITETLGVEPIMINASLVSAQHRKRFFWTNIPGVNLPEDREIVLQDILQEDVDDKYFTRLTCSDKIEKDLPASAVAMIGRKLKDGKRCDNDLSVPYTQRIAFKSHDGKSGTLSTVQKDNLLLINKKIRKFTPIECERLQGLPDNYTSCISDSQRYKCLGNAFNVDVIAHILSYI
jgi:DNA-cytosine methyltransferase